MQSLFFYLNLLLEVMKYHLHALQLCQLFWPEWKCLGISYKEKEMSFWKPHRYLNYVEMFEVKVNKRIVNFKSQLPSIMNSTFKWLRNLICWSFKNGLRSGIGKLIFKVDVSLVKVSFVFLNVCLKSKVRKLWICLWEKL